MSKFWLMKLCDKLGLLFSIILLLSCVYSFIKSPHFMCKVYECKTSKSKVIIAIFPRAVAVACTISRITTIHKNTSAIFKYEQKIKDYDFHFPMNVGEKNFRRYFSFATVVFFVVIILPLNAYRIYVIDCYFQDITMNIFFFIMYIQNASIFMIEIQFIAYCFELYQKFQSINDDMATLKLKTILINRYPLILKPDEYDGDNRVGSVSKDFSPRIKEYPLGNCIESLKMRHQFVSESVCTLNELYNIQLGISLSVLFVMAVFDIYDVMFYGVIKITESHILFYGWLFQYTFRFCMIALTTHITTKQANRSKTLLTDINNRYIDSNTKEEIRLFLNELSCRSMEFTTFDFIILNTRIITSAIVVGTTYLVILLQFR